MSVFGAFLVRVFPHSDQKYSEYEHFSRTYICSNLQPSPKTTNTAQEMKFSSQDFFLVNVTKSTGNCGFGHIYWRYSQWKTLGANYNKQFFQKKEYITKIRNINIHKKWCFPLEMSLVNANKSAENCGFPDIY